MHSPKVSVIIPVYNTAPYLHEALSSITGQTLQELEIIIVNDGSTDGSGEIIREVAETDGRIKVFEQENQGQSVARNVGLEQATGEYIYFMDSDDLLSLNALEICYDYCLRLRLDFVFLMGIYYVRKDKIHCYGIITVPADTKRRKSMKESL